MIINRFIGGNSIHKVKKLNIPFGKIYDYVKEGNPKDHLKNHKLNLLALNETTDSIHAIKLTSLYNSNLKDYLDEYKQIAKKNNHKILIDAENVQNQDMINEYSNYCIERNEEKIFYKTYQMYRNDSLKLLKNDLETYNENLLIKLVRGAYHNEDKQTGLLFLNKKDSDDCYNQAIKILSNTYNSTIIASHNNKSCNLAEKLNKNNNFKFAQLLGMNDTLSYKLLKNGNKVYKYIPYGKWRDSIPYLTRRLYENYEILKYSYR